MIVLWAGGFKFSIKLQVTLNTWTLSHTRLEHCSISHKSIKHEFPKETTVRCPLLSTFPASCVWHLVKNRIILKSYKYCWFLFWHEYLILLFNCFATNCENINSWTSHFYHSFIKFAFVKKKKRYFKIHAMCFSTRIFLAFN